MELASENPIPGPTRHDLLYAYTDMRAKNPGLNAALPSFISWSWGTTSTGANCLASKIVAGLCFKFCGVFSEGRTFIWALSTYQIDGTDQTALIAADSVIIPQDTARIHLAPSPVD